jgi:hypothetical protein
VARCQHCGLEVSLEHGVQRVVLANPDRPGDYYVFSKNKKRMTRIGKPKGPGVVASRSFCPECADFLDRLLEEEHARQRVKQRWALAAGTILVVLLIALAVVIALQ